MNTGRIYSLEEDGHTGAVRFLSGFTVSLDEGRRTSVVTIVRTGSFNDPRYGQFEITRQMLLQMVENFEANVYGQDIFVDVAHRPSDGAAAKILSLFVEGNRLRARVEWTDYGLDAVRRRGFQYLSAEFHENWQDNEQNRTFGPVLLGAALTVRPVIKRLDPIQLSEASDDHAVLVHPELESTLKREITTMWKNLIDKLRKQLAEQRLSEAVIKRLAEAFASALEGVTEEQRANVLLSEFIESGKALAGDRRMLLGDGLAGFLNRRIEELVSDGQDRADVVRRMAQAGGINESTVNQILLGDTAGGINCPPIERLNGFARALNVSAGRLREIAERDGCTYGNGNRRASSDPLTAADVERILEERERERAETEAERTRRLEENRALFAKVLDEAEGLKALSEETRTQLAGAADLITAEMTEGQVRKLAEHQVNIGGQISAQAKLAGMGFVRSGGSGSVVISLDESNTVKKLQETVDRRLGILDLSDARRYARTGGQLVEENKKLAERVLAMFDADPRNRTQLEREAKQLASGDSVVSDVNVPVVWERTVIREALYQVTALMLMDTGVEQFATSYMIPYSFRDTGAAGVDNTRKYEGQAISRAGVTQTAETAYNRPQKLAFEVSDELRYLTAARHLDWDAVAENQRNATRIISEDSDRLAYNELLQASDEFGAVVVSVAEDLEPQADDTKNLFVLANFPVVRPRAVYDLQGNQVGSTVNPIVVTYDSVARAEWDGTGSQPAGIYYVLDYNLGEIRLVDEAGDTQVPADATAYTITYSYATNVYAFDTDLGGAAADAHWDTFLYRYGLRKSVVEDDRFHEANFGVMRGAVMTQIEQAKQFGANHRRPGTDLSADGSLGRIKDVPNFKAFGPNLHIGDQRLLIGERGVTRFRMTRPWMLGELENQKDANGRFTGKKEAYGDQFIVIHTPTQLKRALTSFVLYSAAGRVARTV